MFKIGDKVKRINGSFGGMNKGDIGTIIEINESGLKLKEYVGTHVTYNLKLIELMKEKPKKVIKRFGIANFMDELNKK